MHCVHPKGSKCSLGSLPTQPIVSHITSGKAWAPLLQPANPDMLWIGKRHNQQGKHQGGAPKPFIETKPIEIHMNPKLGKQEEVCAFSGFLKGHCVSDLFKQPLHPIPQDAALGW